MKMADDEAENTQLMPPGPGEQPVEGGTNPKAPGWYPDRANPTDQAYWDGQTWAARRRWAGTKGWLTVGDAPAEDSQGASVSPPSQRLSANPYVAMAPARSSSTGFTFNLGVLLLLVSGVALMYGSVGEWVHVSGSVGVANFHVSFNGIDPGISTLITVNGWITFIGGLLIVIFACFEMTSEELQLSILTTVIAALTTIFAIYDMFRIVQKINQVPALTGADVSVGWGLICVLSAAVLATLVAIVRLLQR
jgi:fluoride ion exporter CrcB/FEX